MVAQLIDGIALSTQLRNQFAQQTQTLTGLGVRPGLAVLLVGDDPASQVYVRNKVKACTEAGFHSVLDRLPAQLSQGALLEPKPPCTFGYIEQLNLLLVSCRWRLLPANRKTIRNQSCRQAKFCR